MKKLLFAALSSVVFLASCNDDDAVDTANLRIEFDNLPVLESGFVYEGWLATPDGVETAGRFTTDANGVPSTPSIPLSDALLSSASAYILTIEPANETGADLAAPSDVHLLAGDFSGSNAALTIGDPRALGTDFSTISGNYILATPTTAATDDETSGVWFIDISGGSPAPGLNLPALPSGWRYEGWAVVDGTPYSTGKFSTAMGADEFGGFSGPDAGPPFPGEDFIQGRPSFPLNLQGGTIVLSVEPNPDDGDAPFALKPLVSDVAMDAADHSTFSMTQNLGNIPTGTVRR